MEDREENEAREEREFSGIEEPFVSVIMSVFNGEDTVAKAIESIFAQTYNNWELVICDDASTDSTYEVISRIAESAEPGRIKVIRNESNMRLAASLNRCLEVSKGEFIARMDADDKSTPERFEKQIKYLQDNPSVDLVGSSMRRFNADGPGAIVKPATFAPDRYTLAQSLTVPFFHATILARREVFEKVGNYTVSWRTVRGQDLDLWFKFFAADLVGNNLPEVLYWVREDEKAIRRRTPKARFGSFVTRVRGSITLGHPPKAYLIAFVELLKILLPYQIFDWHRRRSHKNAQN